MHYTKFWANHLRHRLINTGLNSEQVTAIVKQFEASAATTNEESAFTTALESYGSESTPDAVKTIKSELERLLDGQSIDTNPLTRMSRGLSTFNKNIAKVEIEVCGVDMGALSPHQLEGVRAAQEERKHLQQEMPQLTFKNGVLLKPLYYSALAKCRNRQVKLELEIVRDT